METQFLHANRLTEEAWPETVYEYTLENMLLSRFMGTGADNIIQIDNTLKKQAGDLITMRLRMPLQTAGGYDDSDIEGNEEALDFHNFQVQIHERSKGVRSAGKMSEKRTKINFRREAVAAIALWRAEQIDNDFVYALSGLGNQNTYVGEGTSDIETVNEHAPSTNRILYGGQTLAGVVTMGTSDATIGQDDSTDYADFYFGTKMISILKRAAVMATPKIRPITIHGKRYYLLLLHPYQVKSLRLETGDHGWAVIQSRAGIRGLTNPLFQRIFDGAIGVYDDVILYEYDRIQTRTSGEYFHSNTDTVSTNISASVGGIARALFLGAQAGVMAIGQMPKRYEKDFDFDRKPGTAMDEIYGISKTVFNDPGANQNANTAQEDFATMCLDTCFKYD